MKLTAKASLQIQKPINEVFEGIVNPAIMTNYFISESSGRMETGKELSWKFPEFKAWYPVTEVKIETNRSISFVWDPETRVQIKLEDLPDQSTLVRVSEKGKELNDDNLKWLVENTAGWANFLDCMKAYLEHGIHLRKGAYDFISKKESPDESNA